MSIKNAKTQKVCLALVSGFLVLTFVFSQLSNIVYAQYAVTEVGPALEAQERTALGTTKTAISSTISSIKDSLQVAIMSSLEIKEFAFDTVAWGLVNVALQEMIRSTTQWVNSGFQGSPAFVTDLNGYMTDLADRVAGDVIWGSKLRMLCSPFKLNIQLALEIQYNESRNFETQCRLSQVVGNMDAFFGGDFLAGGWDGWYQMAMIPQNNPYGALLESRGAVRAAIENEHGSFLETTGWANGFLSVKECGQSAPFTPPKCTTVTPGIVVERQLNKAIGGPQDRLTIADELNELLGALFMQLAGNVLDGAGGLLGLTDSNYGSGDYFDRVAAEQRSISQASQVNTSAFTDVIKDETEFRNNTQSILTRIERARTYKNETYGTSTRCSSGALTDSLVAKRTTAQQNLDAAKAVLLELTELKTDLSTLQNTAVTEAVERALWTKYQASNTTQAIGNLMNKFMVIRSGGRLHNPSESVRIELEVIPALREEIATFTKAIDTACRVAPRTVVPRNVIIGTTTATST